jgi:threonine dehydratase
MTVITPSDIEETARLIAPHVRLTPVMTTGIPNLATPVTLKLELFQHAGSFKARGAFAGLLSQPTPPRAVTAASGGNHGAAIAFAARKLGIPARIFVPEISSPAKIARIASYGAEVVRRGKVYAEALGLCELYQRESGALGLHAYDDITTLLGQGTLGREISVQAPDLDTLLVAVGGGGLIGGIASWYRGSVKVVGVEPATCSSLHAALAAGRPVPVSPSGLAADSLGASAAGARMFPIAQAHVDHVALVSDEAIAAAQRFLWQDCQIMAEPGGATALAALLSGAYAPRPGERIGVVVCGGNITREASAVLFL